MFLHWFQLARADSAHITDDNVMTIKFHFENWKIYLFKVEHETIKKVEKKEIEQLESLEMWLLNNRFILINAFSWLVAILIKKETKIVWNLKSLSMSFSLG